MHYIPLTTIVQCGIIKMKKNQDARQGKEKIMKTIETIVMKNNHTGSEDKIAALFDIKYDDYLSAYHNDTNCTTIHYICHV